MTKPEFIAKYIDEARGLSVAAIAQALFVQKAQDIKPGSQEAAYGRFTAEQFRKVQNLLDRIAGDLIPEKTSDPQNRPIPNGTVPTRKA